MKIYQGYCCIPQGPGDNQVDLGYVKADTREAAIELFRSYIREGRYHRSLIEAFTYATEIEILNQ